MSRLDLRSFAAGRRVGEASGGTTDYTQLSNKPTINGVELTGDMTVEELFGSSVLLKSELEQAVRNNFIRNFAKCLDKYDLSLADYGKIRAAMYYNWSENPELTAEEITSIFGANDPAEMDSAELEAAVLEYSGLTGADWNAICTKDAQFKISSTYLRNRAEIQDWIATHIPEE